MIGIRSVSCRLCAGFLIITASGCGLDGSEDAVPSSSTGTSHPSEPSIYFEENVVELGAGLPGEILNGTLTLANAGAVTDVSLIGSCHCTSIEPSHVRVATGESIPVRVSLRLPLRSGGMKTAAVTARSKYAEVTAVARGNCPPVLSFSPSSPQIKFATDRGRTNSHRDFDDWNGRIHRSDSPGQSFLRACISHR